MHNPPDGWAIRNKMVQAWHEIWSTLEISLWMMTEHDYQCECEPTSARFLERQDSPRLHINSGTTAVSNEYSESFVFGVSYSIARGNSCEFRSWLYGYKALNYPLFGNNLQYFTPCYILCCASMACIHEIIHKTTCLGMPSAVNSGVLTMTWDQPWYLVSLWDADSHDWLINIQSFNMWCCLVKGACDINLRSMIYLKNGREVLNDQMDRTDALSGPMKVVSLLDHF